MFVNTLTRTCDTCFKTCENATITQRDQFTNLHQHRKGLTVNICRNKNVVYHSKLLLAEPAFAAESVNKSFLFRVVFKIALLKSHFTVPVLTRYLSVKDSRYTGMILNMFAFTQSCRSLGLSWFYGTFNNIRDGLWDRAGTPGFDTDHPELPVPPRLFPGFVNISFWTYLGATPALIV